MAFPNDPNINQNTNYRKSKGQSFIDREQDRKGQISDRFLQYSTPSLWLKKYKKHYRTYQKVACSTEEEHTTPSRGRFQMLSASKSA